MARESYIEKTVCRLISEMGGEAIKVGHSGYPDRLVLFRPDRYFWIEFKQKTGALRPNQKVRIRQLEKAGDKVWIIRSVQEFKDRME